MRKNIFSIVTNIAETFRVQNTILQFYSTSFMPVSFEFSAERCHSRPSRFSLSLFHFRWHFKNSSSSCFKRIFSCVISKHSSDFSQEEVDWPNPPIFADLHSNTIFNCGAISTSLVMSKTFRVCSVSAQHVLTRTPWLILLSLYCSCHASMSNMQSIGKCPYLK